MAEHEVEPVKSTDSSGDRYDGPWKEAIEQYFQEFMALYFPVACAEIDWCSEYVFLDQELRSVVQDAELGTRFVDKLVRVSALNGDERWIYVHIEVQGTRQPEFPQRMYTYNYRIYDRYKTPVASMAVLSDEHRDWRPDNYHYDLLGCRLMLEFPMAKLIDYEERLDELLAGDNAFGFVTAAHLLTQRTQKQDYERYLGKLRLVRLLYERNWDKQRVINLFSVLDWMIRLPDELNSRVYHEIEQIEENGKVEYVTSVERIGIAKGLEKGLEKGRAEGRAEGRVEGEYRLLRRQLERRFGVLPEWVTERLIHATEEELEAWGEAVLTAPTLDEVFRA